MHCKKEIVDIVIDNNKNADAICLYVIDKQVLSLQSNKFELKGKVFVDWYKSVAEKLILSNSLSKKIFYENETVGKLFLYNLFSLNLLGNRDLNNHAYFYLDRWFAQDIINEMSDDSFSWSNEQETGRLNKLLFRVTTKQSIIMVEYSKKDGWFEFESSYPGSYLHELK